MANEKEHIRDENGSGNSNVNGMFRTPNFKKGFITTSASVIVYMIAFASPYWLETYHSVPYDFNNMGLWEICFSKYYFRDDIFAQEYDGCHWSFSIELENRRDIFNPGFFVMVQVFSVAVLFMYAVVCILMIFIFLRCLATTRNNWTYWILSCILCGLSAIVATLEFVMVITIGVKSGDRQWMPRADLVWLSWGYAFTVLCSFLTYLAAYFFGRDAKYYWGTNPPPAKLPLGIMGLPLYRQGDAGIDPPDTGSVFTPSHA